MSDKVLSISKQKQTTERAYSLDLFRIVSMLLIVCLHVIGQGGILANVPILTVKGEMVWFLEIAAYCSVNCFALLSGYLGIHSSHKWKNIVSLATQALFYCFLFTSIYVSVSLFRQEPLQIGYLLKSMIPALFGRYWYFSAYFCLFFFMPILDRVVNMPKPILKRAMVVVFVIFCCFTEIKDKVSSLSGGYSFLWLAILYVIGGYMSQYKPLKKLSPAKSFAGYLICVLVSLSCKMVVSLFIGSNFALISYTSPTIFLSSLFLLNAFAGVKINSRFRKGILFFSSCSFGVYLIHCQPVIFDHLLHGAFSEIVEQNTIVIIVTILVATVGIYLICSIIEYLRQCIFKWLKIDCLVNTISQLITKVFDKIEGTE